jgi:hypothetical protein
MTGQECSFYQLESINLTQLIGRGRSKFLIIGSGFASAANLLHLVEAGIKPSQTTIFGPGRLGTGNAYGCDDNDFRLDVRPIFWCHFNQRRQRS